MTEIGTVATPVVAFSGLPYRTGPLSWGQRWSWDIIQELVPNEQRTNLSIPVPVGPGRTLADVLATATQAVVRFETLRTTYRRRAGGEPEQVVLGEGTLPVRVRDAGDPPAEDVAQALGAELVADRFDLESGPLVAFGVVTSAGRPILLLLGMSNIVADLWSLTCLWRWLQVRLDGTGDESAEDPADPQWQPLEQAADELSERSRAAAAQSLAYWREQLDLIRAIPSPSARPACETPRYWGLRFTSAALSRAAHLVAARTGVSASAALLGGLAAVVGLRVGQAAMGMSIVTNNRYRMRTRQSVGRLSQAAPVCLDLSGETFDTVLSDTASRMVRAARYGQCDPIEVSRLVNPDGPHRGAHQIVPVIFDYLSRPDQEPRNLTTDVTQLSRIAVGSTLRWSDCADEENLQLFVLVHRFDTEADIVAWVDTAYLSRPDLAGILFGVERLLITAAAGDVAMSRLGAVTGVP